MGDGTAKEMRDAPVAVWQPLPPMTSFARRGTMFDPVENAKAAMRYMRERYGSVDKAWEAYSTAAYREYLDRPWPVSPAPSSPHGDPMASAFGRR